MQIWKKDDKGRWLARQSDSLHQLHHRMSLAQFVLKQKRFNHPGIFIIFTEGEVDTLASEFNRYLVEGKSTRWCRTTKALNMLKCYVRHLERKGAAVVIISLPQHNAHDFEEDFKVVPPTSSRKYVGIYINN